MLAVIVLTNEYFANIETFCSNMYTSKLEQPIRIWIHEPTP